jgi:FixJ family two-component response regulator
MVVAILKDAAMLSTIRRSKPPVISIIDDDKSMRSALNRLVKSLGFEPQTFASAEEFLQSTHLYDSSCVIADVRMPGMSGMALQQRMNSSGRDLPIVFITAYPEEAVRAQALEAGAIAFLSKPFDGKTLIRSIGTALRKGQDDKPVS